MDVGVRKASMEVVDMKISFALLGIIIVVFLLQMAVPGFTEAFYFNPGQPNAWMFITSIFLHGGLVHILFNGYALFMFGPFLENRMGQQKFLMFFIAAGIVGNILYYATILLGIIPPIPALGASGAIYGVLGALAIIEPNMRLLFWGIIPMSIGTLTVVWIITETIGSFNPYSGVGSAAHLGGLLFGLAYAKFLFRPPRMAYPLRYRAY